MKEQDRVLDFLMRTAQAIADMFGESCETLIHDMSRAGHPLIAIFNGHVSGREPGSCSSIFDGESANPSSAEFDYISEDAVNTLAVTKLGKFVKSTTIHYQGHGFHYALGINFDYTKLIPVQDLISSLTHTSVDLEEHLSAQNRLQLDDLIDDCARKVGKPLEAMKKQDRIQLIMLLMKMKAFELQKSVTRLAERMGVSRYTIYKYIHEVEENLSL